MSSEKQIKSRAGYVQVEGFEDAHQGYFCGTCRQLAYGDTGMGKGDGRDGYCMGLEVPIRTYGCCNNWKLAPDSQVRGANGARLRVLR
jgi:hypothetical protein